VNEFVLIADSDAERGRRIATACHAQGLSTRLATHGAAALEIALAETPVAMVAQLELALIDGPRLSEILQANPRTRGMGILFVGDEHARARPGASGRVIPGHADPDTIARFVEAILAKRSAHSARDRQSTLDAGGVEGQLSQIALGELLDLFHVNRKTGTVELRRGSGRRVEIGRVYLRDGAIIEATIGSIDGEKALYRLFAWKRGSFAFRPGKVNLEARIDRPVPALLREGQRQAAEWERLASELPPGHARVALKVSRGSLPNVLHPLTQEVLLLLELSDRVEDVLDRCSFPDYQVLRTLYTLIRRGMVELRGEPGGERSAGLFAAGPAARLREWVEQGRPRGAQPVDAKVLVIGSDAGALRAFATLLGRLPGAEVAPEASAPVVTTLGRLPVDEDLAIELIEAPATERFAAVWPLAAHGALATVFIHAGPADRSIAALKPAHVVIDAMPRTRTLHVLLQDKEDRAPVETVCERLGLYDDRSVLTIEQEQPDRAMTMLRELLARLLP
jgi:CheY-like chemotaxis protein